MATDTDKLSSADASPQPNPNNSIDLTTPPSSDTPDRSPSAAVSDSQDSKKGDGDSATAKLSPVVSSSTAPVSDAEKKIRRAERFGINVQLSEQEKRNSRAERFGTQTASGASSALNNSEELKRKARAERFGLPVTTDEDAKKKARLERFAATSKTDVVEEEKKKARELRFSQPSGTLSTNGKATVEPKAAIAGQAGGEA